MLAQETTDATLILARSIYERSKGIAVASLNMFKSLAFSAEKSKRFPLVDGEGSGY